MDTPATRATSWMVVTCLPSRPYRVDLSVEALRRQNTQGTLAGVRPGAQGSYVMPATRASARPGPARRPAGGQRQLSGALCAGPVLGTRHERATDAGPAHPLIGDELGHPHLTPVGEQARSTAGDQVADDAEVGHLGDQDERVQPCKQLIERGVKGLAIWPERDHELAQQAPDRLGVRGLGGSDRRLGRHGRTVAARHASSHQDSRRPRAEIRRTMAGSSDADIESYRAETAALDALDGEGLDDDLAG